MATSAPLQPPPSLRPGSFPRQLLQHGESILFETRPGLLARYWGRITVFAFLLILFTAALFAPGDSTNPVAYFFVGIWIVLIAWTILLWRGIAYCLTDRRVLSVGGVRQTDVVSLPQELIQGLNLTPGSSNIVFTPISPVAPAGRSNQLRPVQWLNVPNPSATYDYLQELFAQSATNRRIEATRKALLAKALEGKVPCAYCRGLIDVSSVNAVSPKCPRCGAPLIAASEILTPV